MSFSAVNVPAVGSIKGRPNPEFAAQREWMRGNPGKSLRLWTNEIGRDHQTRRYSAWRLVNEAQRLEQTHFSRSEFVIHRRTIRLENSRAIFGHYGSCPEGSCSKSHD